MMVTFQNRRPELRTDLYLDTEFNEFGGSLISLALVSYDGASEFYEVVPCYAPKPWVKQNVMPVLNQAPIEYRSMQERLAAFLGQFDRVRVIADWPDDIRHFCAALITGPGLSLKVPPITFELRQELSSADSRIPHNALEDARAIRDMAIGA